MNLLQIEIRGPGRYPRVESTSRDMRTQVIPIQDTLHVVTRSSARGMLPLKRNVTPQARDRAQSSPAQHEGEEYTNAKVLGGHHGRTSARKPENLSQHFLSSPVSRSQREPCPNRVSILFGVLTCQAGIQPGGSAVHTGGLKPYSLQIHTTAGPKLTS